MSLSRILKVLSLSVVVMVGDGLASSSSSLLEAADDLSEFSLRRYLVTAESILNSLVRELRDVADLESLQELRETLQDYKESADFLSDCNKHRRFEKYKSHRLSGEHLNVFSQNSKLFLYKKFSNISIGYVCRALYDSSRPVGFYLSFEQTGPTFGHVPKWITTYSIPFQQRFFLSNQHNLLKILRVQAFGVGGSEDIYNEFYDEAASLEIRKFFYHGKNLETFFTLGQVLPLSSDKLTGYQYVFRSILKLLRIDITFEMPPPDSLNTQEGCKASWENWKNDLAKVISEASINKGIRKTLLELIQFNPYNIEL